MNPEFVQDSLLAARKLASYVFIGWMNAEEHANDAVSFAWQLAVNASPNATPGSIARIAVRRVKRASQFKESVRSASHPRHWERRLPWKVETPSDDDSFPCSQASYFAIDDDPALIAQIRIDAEAWFASLSPRLLQVATLLGVGYRNFEIAAMLNVSFARVSGIREELRDSWADFTRDPRE
jgi:hypothetical protein